MRLKWYALSFLYAFLIFGSVSCRDDVVWNASVKLDAAGWNSREPATFVIDPAAYRPDPANRFEEMTAKATGDTIASVRGKFRAFLSLRYTPDCNASEVKICIEHSSLDSPLRYDTLSYRLFSESGKPLGSGRLGIYEISRELPGILNVSEGSSISVSPIEYSSEITGISDITLILKNSSL